MNAEGYLNILMTHFLPSTRDAYGKSIRFMQYNAAVHKEHIFDGFFKNNNISEMDWSAKSPKLNPIENIWRSLRRMGYAIGRQYSNVSALVEAIIYNWEHLYIQCINTHIVSMP